MKSAFLLVLSFAFLFPRSGISAGTSIALELPVPKDVFATPETRWTGIYFEGRKCGWGRSFIGPDTLGGRVCVTTSSESSMTLGSLENVMKVSYRNVRHYGMKPPHRAFLIEDFEGIGNQERRTVLRQVEGTTYKAEITEAEKTRVETVKNLDVRLCQETTGRVWASDPDRKPGDSIAVIGCSGRLLKNTRRVETIVRASNWSGPAGSVPVWEMNVSRRGGEDGVIHRLSRKDGDVATAVMGRALEYRREPEKLAKQIPAGPPPDLLMAMAIASDQKLGGSTALTETVFELTAPEGREVPDLPQTASQSVERKANGTVIVRTGTGKPRKATAEERAYALKATTRYPIRTEVVRRLAAIATGGAKSDRTKVQQLLQFTDSYIQDNTGSKGLTVMDVIKSKKGDCTAHSVLFATLARAAGIPAREAGGWMYMGDQYQAFGGHAWNEVVLEGCWVPVDAVFRQIRLDGGHIQECSGDENGVRHRQMVTGLKAKIISVRKKPSPSDPGPLEAPSRPSRDHQ